MANKKHLALAEKGSHAVNDWRQKNPKIIPDLSNANLKFADLRGANLENALLMSANLSDSSLRNANLKGADLWNALLEDAVLIDANLQNAELSLATFANTDLERANFTGATMGYTTIVACDLTEVVGLDTIVHRGPSSIGVDTLQFSLSMLPHSFLKGCGLPDHIIEFVESVARKPIQFYSCFLSHSAEDKPFAKHLYDKLQGSSVRCWYFPESARTGEKLWDEINKAIRLHDKLVIICTSNSLNSEAVIKEIKEGLRREQEEVVRRNQDAENVVSGKWTQEEFARRRYHTRVLFPIALNDYVFTDWDHPLKYELQKSRVIGDFRNWEDPKTFDKAFQKLLKDLNSSD